MAVVDVPGDERVRQRLFNKYKDSLRYSLTCHASSISDSGVCLLSIGRAVIVVIDSDNFPSEVRSVAELVYDLLLEPAVCGGRVPVLMACNKQDLPLAKDCSAIRRQLEEEM